MTKPILSFQASCLFLFQARKTAVAVQASLGLIDPVTQPLFQVVVPNPLDPSFIYNTSSGEIDVSVGEGVVETGLVASDGSSIPTKIWGYGSPELGYTWPGRTFVQKSFETLNVKWHNKIEVSAGYLLSGKDNSHLGSPTFDFSKTSAVDDSFHWAYSLPGYEGFTIEQHGTPIVPHLHGGHTDAAFDGNPEYFFGPEVESGQIQGPRYVSNKYTYDNTQPAATLWYHDHALGITRLNVYSGMAGFYILRDDKDTGAVDNPLKLPAFPYEVPLVIQDRMFKESGELFYPSFHGDPYWEDFVDGEGATIGTDDSSAMAEVFGDFMTVNGKIWPKMIVEPRQYRLRFLNGCDSRFVVVEFIAVDLNATSTDGGTPVDFYIIGADQGLGTASKTSLVVIGPAQRYDIVFDFNEVANKRVIVKNSGGDEPFGGDIPGPQLFELTDRVMAFDVVLPLNGSVADEWQDPGVVAIEEMTSPDNVRRLGLFEGHDQFGRLQPLLGTIDEPKDIHGNTICYPNSQPYVDAGLVGPMIGTQTWHAPTTEFIPLDAVEDWEIWNLSADAHPVHLHLVSFQLVKREYIKYDSAVTEDGEIEPENLHLAAGDGTYITDIRLVQHDGSLGEGYKAVNPTKEDGIIAESEYTQYADKFQRDVIVALPGQVTTIRAKFDKPGRFNWHCHILAHEDHEMMRVFHVGEMPEDHLGGTCPADVDDHDDQDGGDNNDASDCAVKRVALVPSMMLIFVLYSLT